MNNLSTTNRPFSQLAAQKDLRSFISYVVEELKIKNIYCYINEEPAEKRKDPIYEKIDVERIEFDAISEQDLYFGANTVEYYLKHLIGESLPNVGSDNKERLNYLLYLQDEMSNWVSYYNNRNRFKISLNVPIYEVYNSVKTPTNYGLVNLKPEHWLVFDKVYQIRGYFFSFIYDIIHEKSEKLFVHVASRRSNYSWSKAKKGKTKETNPDLEMYELALSLSYSAKLGFYHGTNRDSFIADFLCFFNLFPDNIPMLHGRLADRKDANPARFLTELADLLMKNKSKTSKSEVKSKR